MFEIERLQSRIKEQEYKYKEALQSNKKYSVLKSIKEQIKKSKEMLEIAIHKPNIKAFFYKK